MPHTPGCPAGLHLYAAFVGRGLELCKPDGYLGAITSRAGLFITTFEKWRRNVVLGNRLITLADLGYRVMHQAKVEAAAYVIGPGRPGPQHTRLSLPVSLRSQTVPPALAEAIARQPSWRARSADLPSRDRRTLTLSLARRLHTG